MWTWRPKRDSYLKTKLGGKLESHDPETRKAGNPKTRGNPNMRTLNLCSILLSSLPLDIFSSSFPAFIPPFKPTNFGISFLMLLPWRDILRLAVLCLYQCKVVFIMFLSHLLSFRYFFKLHFFPHLHSVWERHISEIVSSEALDWWEEESVRLCRENVKRCSSQYEHLDRKYTDVPACWEAPASIIWFLWAWMNKIPGIWGFLVMVRKKNE